jgi:4-oxalmesaconate hydratase
MIIDRHGHYTTAPETGQYFDNTRRYIDAVDWVSAADRQKIYEGNVRKVYPRFGKRRPG